MRDAQHGGEPQPNQWLARLWANYQVLPPQVRFLLWVLTYTIVRVAGLLPSVPHLPPELSGWI
jgi:hypothetical protein